MCADARAADLAKIRVTYVAAHGENLTPLALDQLALFANLSLLVSELSLLSDETLLLLINQFEHA